ncbi:hypothetical protein C8J56DRAFT_868122 [Mycena floridula]|nr:hypothetical protein C8J56DRAFT_868122 [Mycena floridula]
MPRRYHAQRQHIINSLDTLLYHVYAVSCFQSPSLWILFLRLFTQTQCRQPRELDAKRTLRFCMSSVTLCNLPILWAHGFHGVPEGKSVILDFVGMSFTPSRLQLIMLDLSIMFLQLVLTVLAYEVSLAESNPSAEDIFLPIPTSPLLPTTATPPDSAIPYATTMSRNPKSPPVTPEYILDLQLQTLIARIRRPPPVPNEPTLLPLPNTTIMSPRWVNGAWTTAMGGSFDRFAETGQQNTTRTVPGAMETENRV